MEKRKIEVAKKKEPTILEYKVKTQYGCSKCGKVFNEQTNFLKHQKICLDEKKLECDICGKKIKLQSDMKRHIKTHTEEKDYECDECDKKFREKSDLERHKVNKKLRIP